MTPCPHLAPVHRLPDDPPCRVYVDQAVVAAEPFTDEDLHREYLFLDPDLGDTAQLTVEVSYLRRWLATVLAMGTHGDALAREADTYLANTTTQERNPARGPLVTAIADWKAGR